MRTATKLLSPKSLVAKDAITQLKPDHLKVSGLSAEYDTALVADICTELTVPAQIEEEIFYRWTSSNSAH